MREDDDLKIFGKIIEEENDLMNRQQRTISFKISEIPSEVKEIFV